MKNRKPIVFSLVREQSVFMTVIMTLLIFLAVCTAGIGLSIATGVARWNTQWEQYATVQIMKSDNADAAIRAIEKNRDKMDNVREITPQQMRDLMRPWMSGAGVIGDYLPKMYEIKFKSRDALRAAAPELGKNARFLPHADAISSARSAGLKMIMIATLVLVITLGAIGVAITHIVRNTAMLHRREIEILNQIGARDEFVAHQMMRIVGRICATSGAVGFVAAAIMLGIVIGAAHAARVGLMAMMGISGAGWFMLALMTIAICVGAIYITRKTTLKILQED